MLFGMAKIFYEKGITMKPVKDDESYSEQTHVRTWLTKMVFNEVEKRLLIIKELEENIIHSPLKPE